MSCAPNLSRRLHLLDTTLEIRCKALEVGIVRNINLDTRLLVRHTVSLLLSRDDIICRPSEYWKSLHIEIERQFSAQVAK